MFTGIVQSVGRIVAVEPREEGVRLIVQADAFAESDIAVGDSVALNGCCLTLVALEAAMMRFDVSSETLRCTTGLNAPGTVNLEKALRFCDRLGGHLMSGHVDGTGVVAQVRPVADGGSVLLEISASRDLARFVAAKGSIAVDGVSLTVNAVDELRFSVNLIPHTLAVTTLGKLRAGASVNLEVDLIARYLERLNLARSDN
jgi:riboflavin synthase